MKTTGVCRWRCRCARVAGVCAAILGVVLGAAGSAQAVICIVADSGGTAVLPPNCFSGDGYLSPDDVHMIIDGLPAGTQIEVGVEHAKFFNITSGPGGNLGGEFEQFESLLFMQMSGTNGLDGFSRSIAVPVQCETHTGPRTPGNAVQTFPNDMFLLQGEIVGDPDFDLLRVTAGTGFGMPSPGQTTLTRQGSPGSNWSVDSFFDIEYRIDFVGAPGSIFDGRSGSTTGTIRMQVGGDECQPLADQSGCQQTQCADPNEFCLPRCVNFNQSTGEVKVVECDCRRTSECLASTTVPPDCINSCPDGTACMQTTTTNPDGTITICCDCPQAEVCPLPPTDFLCANLQPTDCISTSGVPETCLPREVSIDAAGNVIANKCDCFDDTGSCGPVQVSSSDLSCPDLCPAADERCMIHFNGVSQGVPSVPIPAVPAGTSVTCDCAPPEEPVCPLPPDDFLCANLQPTDCVSTSGLPEQCLPREVTVDAAGNVFANQCDCFEDTDTCGPVSVEGPDIFCPNACPPGQTCEIHFNGVPQGTNFVPGPNVPPGTAVTCDCVEPPQVCPLPPDDFLCANLQPTDCVSTSGLAERCLPREVTTVVGGGIVANKCDCFEDADTCGPVEVIGPDIFCPNVCPPGEACEIHFNGVPQGVSFVPGPQVPPGTAVTCECVGEPQVCPVPPDVEQWCANLQPTDCITDDPANEECLPRSVQVPAAGGIFVDECDCFQPGGCGAVDITATDFRCPGICPPGDICAIHLNGVATNPPQPSVPHGAVQPGTQVTCDCAACVSPRIIRVESVAEHGQNQGFFANPVGLVGFNIEPRTRSVTGLTDVFIRVTFDKNIAAGSAVVSGGPPGTIATSNNTQIVIISFPGALPSDDTCYTFDMAGTVATDGCVFGPPEDTDFCLCYNHGDVDRSGVVNNLDKSVIITAGNFGMFAGAALDFNADLDRSGVVNNLDKSVVITAGNFGSSTTTCPP